MSGVLMLNNKNYTATGNLRIGGGSSGGIINFSVEYDSRATGIYDTDYDIAIITLSATANATITLENMSALTNTGGNEGYINIQYSDGTSTTDTITNLITDAETAINDYTVNLSQGDTLSIHAGFLNAHTNCWWDWVADISIEGSVDITVSDSYLRFN